MRRKKRWVFLALIVIVVVAVVLARREPRIEPGSFLVVPVRGSYSEGHSREPLEWLLGSPQLTLADLLLELEKASVDERLRGVILKLSPIDLSFAKIQEIRAALQALQAKGKAVIAWVMGEAESGNGEYYLASVADKVYFAENTILPLVGLRARYLFLGGMWEHLGIDMQVEQLKEYKTFGDILVRQTMSEAHREMANALLDNLNEQFLRDIAAARQLTPKQLQSLIDAPTMSPEDYHQAGLIDGIRYYGELLRDLGQGMGEAAKTVSLSTYRQVKPTSVGLRRGPKIAVVYGVGSVTTGKSSWNVTGASMGSETLVEALEEASQDQTIKAIVLRIESPGGSALASDLIWHAVMQAKASKPVIVSMSSVAASGGYYVSASATKIVAAPATLTGSIGIVVLHANIQGLLAKLGLTTETLTRGRYARLFDMSQSWSAEQRQQIKRLLGGLYQTFVRKVATGRKLSVDEVERIGGGRVWTGEQAQELGLVDALGGMATALRIAKEEAGIAAELNAQLVYYPKSPGILGTLLERLSGHLRATVTLPQPLRDFVRHLPASPFIDQRPGPLFAMPILLHIR